jgi:hypothetical protein
MKTGRCSALAVLAFSLCAPIPAQCQDSQSAGQQNSRAPDAGHGKSKSSSRDELVSALESKDLDRTLEVIGRIGDMHDEEDVLPVLKKIWNNDLSDLPQVDSAFVNQPIVRMEVAAVLLQTSRDSLSADLDPHAYISYARKYIASRDTAVVEEALTVLTMAHDPQDAPLFAAVLAQENPATYKAASLAYANNCAVTKDALDQLAKSLKDPDDQAQLYEAWDDAQIDRQRYCKHDT